ncbi:hypothetical protein CBS63078_8524 [Aspergillus niger]|nr:hypothetical protein CBS63078_8524 [Aspergillus niger]
MTTPVGLSIAESSDQMMMGCNVPAGSSDLHDPAICAHRAPTAWVEEGICILRHSVACVPFFAHLLSQITTRVVSSNSARDSDSQQTKTQTSSPFLLLFSPHKSTHTQVIKMPRGAEYDDGVPHSDNAIEAGETKVHGTNPANDHLNRVQRTAPLPEAAQSSGGEYSIGGSSGPNKSGSGKGGHEPKTLGEKKGLGAHKA